MKKILCFMLIALLCVGCGNSNANTQNTESEMKNQNSENVDNTETAEDEEALAYAQAYIDAIRAYENVNGTYGCRYSLIYLDDNDVPELVAGQEYGCISLYTYANGQLYTIIDNWGFGVGGNAGYEYLERQNIIYNVNLDYAGAVNYFSYWKVNENYELEDCYLETLKSSAFVDKDGDGIPSDDEILDDYVYYYGDNEISEEEFNSYMIEGEFQMIDGESSADAIIRELKTLLGVDESTSGADGSANLSVSEYQTICSDLLAATSAYGSSYENMAVHMSKIIADASLVNRGESLRLIDMDKESRQFLALALAYYEFNHEDVYGLTDLRAEDDYQYGAVYNKDEFKKVLSSLCAISDMDGITEYLVDLGENIAIYAADGDAWEYTGGYDIKENDNYVLIRTACYYGHNGGAENVYDYTANMLFVKATDSIFGLRLVYVEGENNDLTKNIASITASSQLANQGSKSYSAGNLIDKNDATAWVESKDGVGVGENIVIKFNGQTLVQEFGIRNGYQASEDTFNKNGYVTRFSVDFGNGVVKEVVCEYPYFYYGEKSLYKVSLDKPVYTDTIIITILDAKAGSKYSDTCISEIEIY